MAEKTTESEDSVSVEASPSDENAAPAKKRRRGSRGGKGRNAAARAAKAAKTEDAEAGGSSREKVGDSVKLTDEVKPSETEATSIAEAAKPRTTRARKSKVGETKPGDAKSVEKPTEKSVGAKPAEAKSAVKPANVAPTEAGKSEEPKRPRRNTRRAIKASEEKPPAQADSESTAKTSEKLAKKTVESKPIEKSTEKTTENLEPKKSDEGSESRKPESDEKSNAKPGLRPAVKPEVLAPFSPKMPPPAPRPVATPEPESRSESGQDEGEKPTRSRRGRSRRSGRLRKLAVDEVATKASVSGAEERSTPESDEEESAAKKRSRRRGGRGRNGTRRSESEVRSESEHDDESSTSLRVKGRSRNGRAVGRYFMCVQRRENATQIAVLEGRSLIEHYVSRPNDDVAQIDGNIYRSIVQNVLPGMEAAFVDIGTPKNAVLYRSDVRFDPKDLADDRNTSNKKRIEEMIKANEVLVAQVTKNPIGLKGARLNQEISLPGRFVVLMPNNSTYGISKRLPDNERKRLRRILDEVKPEEHGIILRTAAEGANADELKRDVERLVKTWKDIEAKAKKGKGPQLLYREPEMAVRIIREEFNQNYRSVLIDDRELYEEVHEYVSHISPELADRIEYYDRDVETLSLFERHHVAEQLTKALDRKVWLPSGGSLIIERTEALTVIDVNTGKNVGKSSLEETVFRNNLEAADEIARQLRLRDIGGIIVIDFIDMEVKGNREAVLERLREALARDKTRTQAFPIGELGLVEMTRKRISEGLVESFSSTCETCTGRGFVVDEELLEGH